MPQAAWFKFFGRHQAMFDAISDEQAGQVIKAALSYLNTGEVTDMDPIAFVAFTVYIPPFWCGVIATLLVEIGLVIGLVIIMTIQDKK